VLLHHSTPAAENEAMVLTRVQLDSPNEEFLFSGRKFVPWRNWGGKAVDEKT